MEQIRQDFCNTYRLIIINITFHITSPYRYNFGKTLDLHREVIGDESYKLVCCQDIGWVCVTNN